VEIFVLTQMNAWTLTKFSEFRLQRVTLGMVHSHFSF